MADILEFRPAESKRHGDGASVGERGPAEVVVFPGVRYEHWADARGHAEAVAEARRQRDVIELAE